MSAQLNEKELLVAQLAYLKTLAAAESLEAGSDFSWAEKRRGEPLKLTQKSPEVNIHAVLLLLLTYHQAAIRAFHEDTHVIKQQALKLARWHDINRFVKTCDMHKHVKPTNFLTALIHWSESQRVTLINRSSRESFSHGRKTFLPVDVQEFQDVKNVKNVKIQENFQTCPNL